MSTLYKCKLLEMHGDTTGHVPMYFQNAINEEAIDGWKFVQAIRMSGIKYTLIFERMDG